MPSDAHGTRVLVVDDNEVLLRVVRRVLTEAGHTILTAATSTEALRHLAAQPDLAVLDLRLADGTGADLACTFRAVRPDLPLILMTASPLRIAERQDLSATFTTILTKPVGAAELRCAVALALGRQPAAVDNG